MVFVVGPRQVGKTWLARRLAEQRQHVVYLNYDHPDDRRVIQRLGWHHSTELLVLDEVHKMRGRKRHLKGVFDTWPRTISGSW